MVAFPLDADPLGASLVAWTTTPWTLPSNLALCVNPDLPYVFARNPASGAVYCVAEALLSELPPPPAPAPASAGPAAASASSGAKAEKVKEKKQEKQAKDAAIGGGGKGGAEAGDGAGKGGAAAAGAWEIVGRLKGSELAGRTYRPLFRYFEHLKAAEGAPAGTGAFRVICDGYVTADSGTGVVHCAPAFGEDDHRVCLAAGIIVAGKGLPNPVDVNGRFTSEVPDFAGQYVKDADRAVIKAVKDAGRLVHQARPPPSFPFLIRPSWSSAQRGSPLCRASPLGGPQPPRPQPVLHDAHTAHTRTCLLACLFCCRAR